MTRKALTLGMTLAVTLAGCAAMKRGEHPMVQAQPDCQDVTFAIYFQANASALTPDGRRLIADAATRTRPCKVEHIRVVGLADGPGETATNLALSRQRAAAVVAALGKAGLPTAAIDVTAAGEAGATDQRGLLRPVRRRADITLKLRQP